MPRRLSEPRIGSLSSNGLPMYCGGSRTPTPPIGKRLSNDLSTFTIMDRHRRHLIFRALSMRKVCLPQSIVNPWRGWRGVVRNFLDRAAVVDQRLYLDRRAASAAQPARVRQYPVECRLPMQARWRYAGRVATRERESRASIMHRREFIAHPGGAAADNIEH